MLRDETLLSLTKLYSELPDSKLQMLLQSRACIFCGITKDEDSSVSMGACDYCADKVILKK